MLLFGTASMGPKNLDDLPQEILELISEGGLTQKTLGSLRLVSRKLNAAVRSSHIKNLHITKSKSRLGKADFQELCSRPVNQAAIRNLIYHPCTVHQLRNGSERVCVPSETYLNIVHDTITIAFPHLKEITFELPTLTSYNKYRCDAFLWQDIEMAVLRTLETSIARVLLSSRQEQDRSMTLCNFAIPYRLIESEYHTDDSDEATSEDEDDMVEDVISSDIYTIDNLLRGKTDWMHTVRGFHIRFIISVDGTSVWNWAPSDGPKFKFTQHFENLTRVSIHTEGYWTSDWLNAEKTNSNPLRSLQVLCLRGHVFTTFDWLLALRDSLREVYLDSCPLMFAVRVPASDHGAIATYNPGDGYELIEQNPDMHSETWLTTLRWSFILERLGAFEKLHTVRISSHVDDDRATGRNWIERKCMPEMLLPSRYILYNNLDSDGWREASGGLLDLSVHWKESSVLPHLNEAARRYLNSTTPIPNAHDEDIGTKGSTGSGRDYVYAKQVHESKYAKDIRKEQLRSVLCDLGLPLASGTPSGATAVTIQRQWARMPLSYQLSNDDGNSSERIKSYNVECWLFEIAADHPAADRIKKNPGKFTIVPGQDLSNSLSPTGYVLDTHTLFFSTSKLSALNGKVNRLARLNASRRRMIGLTAAEGKADEMAHDNLQTMLKARREPRL